MTTSVSPKTNYFERTSEYDDRILFLSGTWQKPGSEFRFRSTIYVQKNGAAEGAIYWQAIRTHGRPSSFFATEWVRGAIRGRDLTLQGYEVEPGLWPDTYRITLVGDEAGVFGGKTLTYLYNWCGQIEGKYLFRNRKG